MPGNIWMGAFYASNRKQETIITIGLQEGWKPIEIIIADKA